MPNTQTSLPICPAVLEDTFLRSLALWVKGDIFLCLWSIHCYFLLLRTTGMSTPWHLLEQSVTKQNLYSLQDVILFYVVCSLTVEIFTLFGFPFHFTLDLENFSHHLGRRTSSMTVDWLWPMQMLAWKNCSTNLTCTLSDSCPLSPASCWVLNISQLLHCCQFVFCWQLTDVQWRNHLIV